MLRQRAFAGLSQSTRSPAPYICWSCQLRARDTERFGFASRRSTRFYSQDGRTQHDGPTITVDAAPAGADIQNATVTRRVHSAGSKDVKKRKNGSGKVSGRKKGRAKKAPPDEISKKQSTYW
jgi:hypothetical protein